MTEVQLIPSLIVHFALNNFHDIKNLPFKTYDNTNPNTFSIHTINDTNISV